MTTARRRAPWALGAYATSTGLVGLAVAFTVLATHSPLGDVAGHPWELGVLVLGLVLGELRSIPVPRGDGTTSPITISTIFAVALVVVGPLSLGLAAVVLAVCLDDLRTRRRPLQLLFNAGQYVLSMVAARAVFSLASATPLFAPSTPLSAHDVPAALAAGVVFALVNDLLVGVVVALASGASVLAVLTEDPRFTLQTSGLLVGLAPIAALLAHDSVLALPLLVLPVLAIGHAAHLAVVREENALRDPLTGLPNHAGFTRGLQRLLDEGAGAGHGEGPAVLVLQLDHFEDANDALGHEVGTELLAVVGRALTSAAADPDAGLQAARLEGATFAVLYTGPLPVGELVERILAAGTQPADVLGTRLSVQATIGVSAAGGAGSTDDPAAGPPLDAHGVLARAQIALARARVEGVRSAVFTPDLLTASSERVRILPELQEAIHAGQLAVLYQPQVDARTGRTVSVEALVRWDHPTRGRLAPAHFIDLAESSGLIEAITAFVLRTALADTARWRAQGFDLRVSVNVSARQLGDPSLPDQVAGLLMSTGVPAEVLTVEVTENSLMADPVTAGGVLTTLRELGVQLSIDDFGTGYSSLSLLQQLDVDEIKIDRSFVSDMAPGGSDEVLVRSIIELGHGLGLALVAEGVETAEQATRLAGWGCELLQGYWFGRPLDPLVLLDRLQREHETAQTIEEDRCSS